ncbi:MAG: hypothetical protein V1755_15165 [Chloroflexota bacterium]
MAGTQPTVNLTDAQKALVEAPLDSKTFLHGPAGSGKSTVGQFRLRHLFAAGVSGGSILLLTPQRTLQDRYLMVARSPQFAGGTELEAVTIGGLARRLCDLFWPLIAEKAGFAHPERSPFFLTLESSQYYMSHIVRPLLDQGYFQSVTMDRNRLYSQILDSLNKSAAVGFPYTQIGPRLDSAWVGDQAQRRIYTEAQDCATRFREFCLRQNLLDFSLQLEIFWSHLLPDPLVGEHLRKAYRHLIYDNVEEDVPRAHDTIRLWLPDLDSALLIYDEEAGYRRFLGADVDTAWGLREVCTSTASAHTSFVMSPAVGQLANSLAAAIREPAAIAPGPRRATVVDRDAQVMRPISTRFYPELLDQVVGRINTLITEERISPSEIVIVGPYLSDALRFAITSRLARRGIPARTHRPSRSLKDEAPARALLTLSALAHPHWNLPPAKSDVGRAFMAALGMDLVRAHLLEEIVYRKGSALSPFEDINPDMQERITYVYGARYTRLREWLLSYREGSPQPLDYFLRRLFGEVLSQPGFGFHGRLDDARVAGHLVESITKFRLAMEPSMVDANHPDFDIGKEYIGLLAEGVLAAQYLESWRPGAQDAVLIAPAHAFLMMNHPVAFQFWLDPGSSGWFERLDQPLTHTGVLSRSWPLGQPWTLAEEERANIDGMARLVTGLVRRCRQTIYLCISQLGESGFEQRGRLLLAVNQVLHETDALPSS